MLTPRSVEERFDDAIMECMMTTTTLKEECGCARSPTLLSLVSFARARFFVCEEEQNLEKAKEDVGKKTRKREKKN